MNDNVKCKSKYLGSLIVNKNNKAENMVGIKKNVAFYFTYDITYYL